MNVPGVGDTGAFEDSEGNVFLIIAPEEKDYKNNHLKICPNKILNY